MHRHTARGRRCQNLESLESRKLLSAALAGSLSNPVSAQPLSDAVQSRPQTRAPAPASAPSTVSLAPVAAVVGGLTVQSGTFNWQTAPHSVAIRFSANVASTLSLADVVVTNLTTGATLAKSSMSLAFNTGNNTATIAFSGIPGGILPDASYRMQVLAAGVSDASGNTMAADYTFDFYVLCGDATRDQVVDNADLGALAANWMQSSRNFSQGDFNYDGTVDSTDLNILATQWGKKIPMPAASTVYLSDLNPTSAVNGWGPYERDESNGEAAAGDGNPITLNGVVYAKGLGVHAYSEIHYALGGQYSRFTSDIGLDDEAGEDLGGDVIFQVFADGTKLYDSGVMIGSSVTQHVDVSVAGKSDLQLIVLNNINSDRDHADWADAKLTTSSTPPAPPQAKAGGPYTVGEGGTVSLSASGSTGTSPTYAWDLDGDGVFGETGAAAARGNETGASVTFNAAGLDGPSSRTVSLRVTDAIGQTSTTTATINVTNVAPTLTIGGPTGGLRGANYLLNLASSDPGLDTISKWVVNWGDGTAAQTVNGNPSSASHVYSAGGNFTVSATATDEDGTYNANNLPVSIAASLTANAGGPYTVAEGGTVALNGTASTLLGLVASWDLDGDGIYGETGAAAARGNESGLTPTFSAAGLDGPGSVTVNLRILDPLGVMQATLPATINVTNVAPTLTISGYNSVVKNTTYTLSLSASDPGPDTISKWVITWGDGTAAQTINGNPLSASHTFASAGSFNVTATATDEDGTYSSNAKVVTVNASGPNPVPAVPAMLTLSSNPDFVATADFNGDGRPDLVASSFSGSSLSVFLNNNGVFGAPSAIGLGVQPDFVTTADLNADGRADLIVVSFNANSVLTLLGNGNGTFQAAQTFAAGTGPRAAVVGDFNGDGKLDLAMAKSFDKNLTILAGNGNGTFQAPTNAALTFAPSDLVAGDFNRDGKVDLAATDYFGNRVAVMLGNGNATFGAASFVNVGTGPTAIAAGDFDGDGNLELATANFTSDNVSVLKGSNTGAFGTVTTFAAGNGATSISAADVSGDGKLDLVVANATDNNISKLVGTGTGSFQSQVLVNADLSPRCVITVDINSDGKFDVVTTNQGTNTLSVIFP
jgi:hypothetical protein